MSFFDSMDDDLEAQSKADAEASDADKFEPNPGDVLNAILLKADLFTGGQYDPAITITFRNAGDEAIGGVEPGKSGRMFLGAVLTTKMLDAAPKIGTPFSLRYEGKVTPASGGNPYKNWTLVTPWTRDSDESARDTALWTSITPEKLSPDARASQAAKEGDSNWRF